MIRPVKFVTVALFLSLLQFSSLAQNIVYVTPTGAGTMNGTSWQNALKGDDLRASIWTAPNNTTYWLARGTYKPHATSKDSSFYIFNKRINLYGGFAGTETQLQQRDYVNNPTILSGAVHPTDTTLYSQVVIRYQNGDSSILDGFTIRDAYGRTALLNESSMYPTTQSRVYVRNNTFKKNTTIYNSQAAAFVNPTAGHAMFHFFNCVFTENYGTTIGIRQGHEFFVNKASIVADSCRFFSNQGPAVVLYGTSYSNNSSSISITRSQFTNNYDLPNTASGVVQVFPSVPAMSSTQQGNVSLSLDSCYFANNNFAYSIYYHTARADSSRFYMNHCVIDSSRYTNTSFSYPYAPCAVALISLARINKNYILNSRFNHVGSYYSPVGQTTIGITGQDVGIDSTFIYNVLMNNCQAMNPNIGNQAFSGRKSTVYLVNSTLFKNEESTAYGWRMILNEGINSTGSGTTTHFYIQNSIVWPSAKNRGTVNFPKLLINNSTAYASPGSTRTFIKNSIINTFADGGTINNMGDNMGGNIITEPIFKDSLNGNFALICSTGINQGDDALYNTSLGGMLDLNKKNRFNGTIDIGAFENYPDSVKVNLAGPATICAGQTATFTASSVNGGTAPQYNWYVNGTAVGTGASFSSSTLSNNDLVSVVVQSNQRCIEKGKDTASQRINVSPATPAPYVQVSASAMPVCAGTQLQFSASTNLQQPVYQWKLNGNNVGANSATFASNSLRSGDIVTVSVTGNHSACTGITPASVISTALTINVTSPVLPVVQISANPGGNTLPFSITVDNPISGWTYTLYKNGVSTLVTGTTFYNINEPGEYTVVGSGSGCYTTNTVTSNLVKKDVGQVNPIGNNGITLTPVPVRDVLMVNGLVASWNLKYCKVHDAKGRIVMQKSIVGVTSVALTKFGQLAAGDYIVSFWDDEGLRVSYKVLKL